MSPPPESAAGTVFEATRLYLRRIAESDLQELLEVYGDATAMRHVGDGRPLDEAACRRWVDVTARNYRLRGYGMFAVVERRSNEVVGFCGLVHPDGQPEAEVKYALKRRYWGRGYATEAVRATLEYGAAAHGLRRIVATVAPENAASARVLAKCGMHAGELRIDPDGSPERLFTWSPGGE